MRYILQFILGVALIFVAYALPENLHEFKPELVSTGCAVILTLIIFDGGYFLYENKEQLRLWAQIYKPFQRRELRISIAYLMRIEVDGKYLLIKNDRGQNGFQPVGGVYKYFYPEGYMELQQIGVFTDNCIDIDEHSRHDLRCTLDDRKKLSKFLKWFDSGKQREKDPWREFYEELIRSRILPEENFKYFQYEKVGCVTGPIAYSDHFKVNEFLYADIYRPKFSNEKIEDIKKLFATGHSQILFATRDEILQGNAGSEKILPHTIKIFNCKL